MRFSLLALTLVKLISPGRKSRALLGKLMKSLADEYGSGKSAMNPKRFATAFNYRSYQNTFVDRWRRSSEIGRNQIKIEDAAPAFHLLLEEFRRGNGQDEI